MEPARRNLLLGTRASAPRQNIPANIDLTYIQSGGTGLITDWTSNGDAPAWHSSEPLPSGRASYLRAHKTGTAVTMTHGPFTAAANYDTVDGLYFKTRQNALNGQYGTCLVFGVKRPSGGTGSISMFTESDIAAQLKVRFWDGTQWLETAYRASTGGDMRNSYHNWIEGYIVGYLLWVRYWRDNTSPPSWPFLAYDLRTLIAVNQRFQPDSLVLTGVLVLASYYTNDPYVGVSDVVCHFDVEAP